MTLADEAYLASFLARPEWPRVRALLMDLGLSVERLDEVIARVRRDLWRDFS